MKHSHSFANRMGLFGNMARYVAAVGSWSVAMPMVVNYMETSRIEK